ncbi:MAG: hypothetical protein M3Y48_09895 [Actinomycetota bacterium]|nr:hypothetical protein [Actinomycetota bacterium]
MGERLLRYAVQVPEPVAAAALVEGLPPPPVPGRQQQAVRSSGAADQATGP